MAPKVRYARRGDVQLINPTARDRRADGYPEGFSDEDIEEILAPVRDRWGTGVTIGSWAPTMVGDALFARWFTRCERLSSSPQLAYWRYRASVEVGVRHVLGAIRAPTLVVVRGGEQGPEQARYVAEHIDGARYVELPAPDNLFFVGDTGPLLDTFEAFGNG